MHDDIDREGQVEGFVCERQRGHITLHRTLDSKFARVAQSFSAEIEGHNGPSSLLLQEAREIAGAATGLQNAGEPSLAHKRVEHTEEDFAHAAIPPKVLFYGVNLGEFRRVHAAAHADTKDRTPDTR